MKLSLACGVPVGLLLLSAPVWAREIPLSSEPTLQRSWLDSSSLRWNVGSNIPLTEPTQPLDRARCKAEILSANTDEERRVEGAGWMLVEPTRRAGALALVKGTQAFDGECRPTAFQVFVFSEGQFAGTVAPQPMERQADGELLQARVEDDGTVMADFARYRAKDPLCCPSRTATVSYRIDHVGATPILLPERISTDLLPTE
ncbi:LppP/LprE family lipoprotein [Hyalangium versicolor]|uniref:LppP/LprE family lipoprotein n=1 Tax=Hyalangium versicolor TaxID=2861190 RepID=UPI001CCD7A2F|nr:LppP/LprE family lipoprotein [Hyalangium versicolor]